MRINLSLLVTLLLIAPRLKYTLQVFGLESGSDLRYNYKR